MRIFDRINDKIINMVSPVLSAKTIAKYTDKNLLIEGATPYYKIFHMHEHSIDITLNNTWSKLVSNAMPKYYEPGTSEICTPCINTKAEPEYTTGRFHDYFMDRDRKCYILHPNEFVIMSSREIFNIPDDIVCLVHGLNSLGEIGVQIEQIILDSGFKGTINFGVKNLDHSQVVLYEGMTIARAYFLKCQKFSGIHPKKFMDIRKAF